MKKLRLSVVAILAAITSYCSAGAPAFAKPAPPPKPKVDVKVPAPEKLLPLQEGDVIILDSHGFDPELKYQNTHGFPWELVKLDPFVWA